MEQQQEEILMRRSFQKKTVALVLSVLARGLKVCRSVDEPVREMFDGFPEDFIFVLGVYGSRHPGRAAKPPHRAVSRARNGGCGKPEDSAASGNCAGKAFFCRRV